MGYSEFDDIYNMDVEDLYSDFDAREEALSLATDNLKLQAMDKLKYDDDKAEVALSLSTDKARLQAMDKVKEEVYKCKIATSLTTDESKAQAIGKLKEGRLKLEVTREMSTNKLKLQTIEKFENKTDRKDSLMYLRRTQEFDTEFILENIDEFIEFEYQGANREAFYRMYEKNNDLLKNIDFEILDEKYLKLLGEDKINLISCYPNVQDKLLLLNDRQLEVFSKCINNYLERNETEEWQVLADEMLNHMHEYSKLLTNIEDINDLSSDKIENLSRILQNGNFCKITTMEQVENYDEIVRQKYDEIMQDENSTIDDKRQAVVQKIFGHDLNYAKSILERFGENNEYINDGEMKDYVRSLQEIMKNENPEILKEVYDTCESVQMNKIYMERGLKQEYCKKYIEDIFIPREGDMELGETPIYSAGTDFKMIITAVGAYSGINPENYKEDWNRPAIASQQVCTSYIRNDMLGTAGIRNICYGFSNLKPDSLMLSGARDIYSSWGDSLVVEAERDNAEKYYTPDEQINHTEYYNEMNFRRVQDGQKMQPDYIVVFKENGEMLNFEEAKRASKQWGNMPIVIVDKDECLKAEKQKLNDMLAEYENNPTPELAKQINQKVRNNRVTNEDFAVDLEEKLPKIEEKTENRSEIKVERTEKKGLEELGKNHKIVSENEEKQETERIGLEELEENYTKVSANERKKETGKIKNVYMKMQEIIKEENSNERE